jgi:hypothetical protein
MSDFKPQQKTLKQVIADEFLKCSKDPIHFMKKYCIIQHPERGKINFHLFPFQEQCLTDFDRNRFVIINKGRQLGLSTLVAGFVLYKMRFNSDFNSLVIATKQEVAKNLVTKVRVMHENLPSWLKGEATEDNKLSLRFSNGSQIKAIAASLDAGRSESLSLLIIDEAAHIEPDLIEGIWASSQSTLATGGGAILISSPNGTGNLFHRKWSEAEQGKQFFPINLPWYVHPERNQTWRDQQDELLGPKMAAQENDCSFITSGHTVIDGPILEWYKETYGQEPLEKRGWSGDYWVWEYPRYDRTYIVSADVARGDGSDYSAFVVIDAESVTQVAEFKGQLSTTEFGHMLVAVATEWNNALLVIDNGGVGWATIQVALDSQYNNIFFHYKNDPYTDDFKHLTRGYDVQDRSKMIPGVSINSGTRPVMISKLETYFREKTPICKSRRSIDEFFTFIWKGGRAQAQGGYNDDLTMCWAVAFWVRDTALKLRQQGIEITKATLSNFSSTLSPRTSYSGRYEYDNQWKMETRNGEIMDLTWLLGK